MKLSSWVLSTSFWNTIGNPTFLLPMTTSAFSSISNAATSTTTTFKVKGSGVESVNVEYEWTPATIIPPGFAEVCVKNRWGVESTWETLNHGKPWLRAASNNAYIYLNDADGQWWIDKPDGDGVFVAPKNEDEGSCGGAGTGEASHSSPPTSGWRALSPSYVPVPTVEEIIDSTK